MIYRYTHCSPPAYNEIVKLDRKSLRFESLPSYSCTVFKQGYIKFKIEASPGGQKSYVKSWSTAFITLRGTILEIYKDEYCDSIIHKLSMLKGSCGIASEYSKSNMVLRLRLELTKEEFLIRPMGGIIELVSWFEHLQSSINISTDIDKRRMPKILTLSRGNTPLQEELRQTRTLTVSVGKTQAVIPIVNSQFEP